MTRMSKFLKMMSTDAPFVIVLALTLIISGIYISGPWYVGGSTTAVGVSLDAGITRVVTGSAYLAAGAIGLIGVVTGDLRAKYYGTLAVFLSYSFMTILRLLTFGWTPMFWLLILAVALIAGIIHLRESQSQKVKASG